MAFSIRVLKGPSKFDLMLALFDGQKVEFTLAPMPEGEGPDETKKKTIKARVMMVMPEDGSLESWCTVLWIGDAWIDCYYSTKNRAGVASRLYQSKKMQPETDELVPFWNALT